MRALGASFIYAVQTWRQLAAVAEPARGCGRMLINAPGRRRAPTRSPQLSPSPLDGHRLVAPDRESAEVGGLRPVARRTRFSLAWFSCADPSRPSGAPSAFTDHEPETGSPRVCVT
jgi:hypothetical protein